MKKTYAFALTAGLLLLGSCAANEPDGGQTNPNEDGDYGYVRFEIASEMTRADQEAGYSSGAGESAIKDIHFLFYNDAGNYMFDQTAGTGTGYDTQIVDHNGKKCAVVKLNRPAKSVVAIVNAQTNDEGKASPRSRITPSLYTDEDNADDNGTTRYFTMSNATYYNSNDVATYRMPITTDKLFTSASAAANATEAKAIIINVERLAAKVMLSQAASFTNSIADVASYDGDTRTAGKVTFTPEAVFLTATQGNSYLVKNLPAYSADLSWAKASDTNRSFWCSAVPASDDNPLDYMKISDIPANCKGTDMWDATKNFHYVRECTGASIETQTSVIVLGTYTIKTADGNTTFADANGTFWLMAMGEEFSVFTSEKAVMKAMGAVYTGTGDEETTTDKLVKDGEGAEWNGWMMLQSQKAEGKDTGLRCMRYQTGKGYYAAPIERWSTGSGTTKKVWNGIVRNHVYDVEISKITGMGIGLPNLTDPIIPITPNKPDDQNFFLHLNVKVLDWRLVPTQSVEW